MKGFSLFQLLIALTIIGILTSLSIPIYSNHVIHANRLEAEIALKKIASALEQFYTVHNSYMDASIPSLGFSENTKHYALQLTANETDFVLKASPQGLQAEKDAICGTLSLNSLGDINITGDGKIKECW